MKRSCDRRSFLHGAGALAASSVLGANDRVGLGLIGFGLIGKRHALTCQGLAGARILAVAEAHRGRLAEACQFIGQEVRPCADFRQLLDDRRVDAVIVATPDHWHALMTIMACAAGKDVYVEKPLTLFPAEGGWMLQAVRKHQRIVQVGTQQRSGPHYQRARELIQSGHIGKVHSVRMQSFRNVMPGFGRPPDQAAPADLDWEMFLGPAPQHPYNPNRALYHFRWFWDYSGGQMTNLGQHSLDLVDWFLGAPRLRSVASSGGRFALLDNGETPDTQDALFDFGDMTAIWSHREASRGQPVPSTMEFFGAKGSLSISRSGFAVAADRKLPPENAIPRFAGPHPVGGPQPVKDDAPAASWTKPLRDDTGDTSEQFRLHLLNFLDCIRSRKPPISNLESGHRVATWCHLANWSLRLGRSLRWDAARETIVADAQAAERLVRPYRPPWDAVLKNLVADLPGQP